jgi:CRISPR-associated Csx3 family protein
MIEFIEEDKGAHIHLWVSITENLTNPEDLINLTLPILPKKKGVIINLRRAPMWLMAYIVKKIQKQRPRYIAIYDYQLKCAINIDSGALISLNPEG